MNVGDVVNQNGKRYIVTPNGLMLMPSQGGQQQQSATPQNNVPAGGVDFATQYGRGLTDQEKAQQKASGMSDQQFLDFLLQPDSWGKRYYQRHLQEVSDYNANPANKAKLQAKSQSEFNTDVNEEKGGFEPAYGTLMKKMKGEAESAQDVTGGNTPPPTSQTPGAVIGNNGQINTIKDVNSGAISGTVDPTTGQITNGNSLTGSIAIGGANTAEQNKQRILDLINNYNSGLSGLVSEQEKNLNDPNGYLAKRKAENAGSLAKMADLLKRQNDLTMTDKTPGILEDLSSRGLLHSSGVGDSLAKERAMLEKETANKLEAQGLSNQSSEQALADKILSNVEGLKKEGLDTATGLGKQITDYSGNIDASVLENILGAKSGLLQRKYSLEDQATGREDANIAAQNASEAQDKANQAALINSIIGGVTNMAGFGLGGGFSNLANVFKKKAATADVVNKPNPNQFAGATTVAGVN